MRRLSPRQQLQPDQHGLRGCHLKDYQGTTNPNHVTAQFLADRASSATTLSTWSMPRLTTTATAFPLTGMHTVPPRQCTDCHVNNNYNLTTTACATCHLKDYQGTTNPNHVTAKLPADLRISATTPDFWQMPRSITTAPDSPSPACTPCPRVQCTDCHVNNNYNLTSTACVTCHLKDYQGTTNPNHVVCELPADLRSVPQHHFVANATFDHNSTGFPLTGMHTVPPRAVHRLPRQQ